MKTKKRSFWLTLALIAVCVCAAAVFAGCDETVTPPAPHEHSYTEWHHTDAEHWRECPADGAATEKSKHTFVDGKCECGFVDTRTFGTVTGKITLRGGKAPNDYGGVTVDFGDDDVNVSVDENGNFTASHVTVGKDYDVTVSKEGYDSYSAFVGLDEKDQTVAITKPFTLEYKRFDYWVGYDKPEHDFSNVNDENPTIGNNGKTLNVITRDTYGDVAVSLWVKPDNVTGYATQGIFVEFEDGKNVQAAYSKSGWADNGLMWFVKTSDWGKNAIYESKQNVLAPVSEDQNALLTSADGLKVTILRKGEMVYIFADNVLVNASAKALPDGYADDKVKVGFFTFNASAANAVWKFDIEEDVSSYTIPDFNAPTEITAENGAISFDKESYLYGERATITVTPADGYVLGVLEVNGKPVSAEVENNVYSFAVTGEITVTATFIRSTNFDSVTFATPTEANANGLQITLYRDGEADKVGTVANNKFTATDVKPGVWHAKTTQYGVDVALKDVFVGAENVELDMSGVFDTETVVNFATEKTYSGNSDAYYAVPANITGDSYFGMKLKCPDDVTQMANDKVRFGLRLIYEGGEGSMTLVSKSSTKFKLSECNLSWGEADLSQAYHDALKANGLYMVVRIEQSTGKAYVYFGVDKSDLTLVKSFDTNDRRKGKIVKFGAGFWGGSYNASISDLMYGTTMAEALGEQVASIAVTGAGDVMYGQTKQGSITVSESDVYEDVTVTIAEETGFKLTDFKVNNVSIPLNALTVNRDGTYSYTISCYSRDTLNVEAAFIAFMLSDVALTVNGRKAGANVPLSGSVTLTDVDSNNTYTATLTNGTVTVKDMVTPATYKVTFDTANYNEGTITLTKGATAANVALEYKRLEMWFGWARELHDFSAVNNEQAEIKFKSTDKKDQWLNVLSHDKYNDFAASLWIKKGTANKSHDQQGIVIMFDNNQYMLLRCENIHDNNVATNVYKLQWAKNQSINGNTVASIKDQWIEFQVPMTAAQNAAFDSADGLKLTLLRKGKMLYVLADGTLISSGTVDLGDTFATQQAKAGFLVEQCKSNAALRFDIHEIADGDSQMFENVTFNVDSAYNANGKTVTLSRDGETDITATIVNNSFTLPSIKGGLWHAKTTVYGIELATDDVWVESMTAGIAFSKVFGAGKSIGDVTHVSGDAAVQNTLTVSLEGDSYFGLKLTCATDVDKLTNDVARIGLALHYEGGDAGMTLISKNNIGFRLSEMNIDWDSDILTDVYQEGIKNGLYMVVRYEQSTGKAYVYFGTEKNKMSLFKTCDVHTRRTGKIVKFGTYLSGGAYDATISELTYGTSLESLGYSVVSA